MTSGRPWWLLPLPCPSGADFLTLVELADGDGRHLLRMPRRACRGGAVCPPGVSRPHPPETVLLPLDPRQHQAAARALRAVIALSTGSRTLKPDPRVSSAEQTAKGAVSQGPPGEPPAVFVTGAGKAPVQPLPPPSPRDSRSGCEGASGPSLRRHPPGGTLVCSQAGVGGPRRTWRQSPSADKEPRPGAPPRTCSPGQGRPQEGLGRWGVWGAHVPWSLHLGVLDPLPSLQPTPIAMVILFSKQLWPRR